MPHTSSQRPALGVIFCVDILLVTAIRCHVRDDALSAVWRAGYYRQPPDDCFYCGG